MYIDKREILLEQIHRALKNGSFLVSTTSMKEAKLWPQEVYDTLTGRGYPNLDMTSAEHGVIFHPRCAHAEYEEIYSRVTATTYRVEQTCVRCGEMFGNFMRSGGESAEYKRIRRPDWMPKDDPDTPTPEYDGDGGALENEGKQNKGEGGEGGGNQTDGEGEGEGESEGPEGQGDGEGEGEADGEGEGGEWGDGDDDESEDEVERRRQRRQNDEGDGEEEEGGTESDAIKPSAATMAAFIKDLQDPQDGDGEGEGGGEGKGGDNDPEAFKRAFLRLWARSVTPEVQAAIDQRLVFLDAEGADGPGPLDQLLRRVTKKP